MPDVGPLDHEARQSRNNMHTLSGAGGGGGAHGGGEGEPDALTSISVAIAFFECAINTSAQDCQRNH